MRFRIPGLSELTAQSSRSSPLVNVLAGLLSVLLASNGIQSVNIDSITAALNSSDSAQSELAAGGSSTLDELLQSLPTSQDLSDPVGNVDTNEPSSTPPNTQYFLAASLPKISGDPEAIHPVVFSYMHNNDGTVSAVTGGTWTGVINGKPIQAYEQAADDSGATAGMLALKVKEADLKNFDITFTKDNKGSSFVLDDPQLKTDAQTTLFVPGS